MACSTHNLYNDMETMNELCYSGDKLDVGGGCKAVVTTRVRKGWVRFRKCGELLL